MTTTTQYKPKPKDELCTCNHKKTQHTDFSLIIDKEYGLQWHPDHHGQCTVKNCKCTQFTWKSWIY